MRWNKNPLFLLHATLCNEGITYSAYRVGHEKRGSNIDVHDVTNNTQTTKSESITSNHINNEQIMDFFLEEKCSPISSFRFCARAIYYSMHYTTHTPTPASHQPRSWRHVSLSPSFFLAIHSTSWITHWNNQVTIACKTIPITISNSISPNPQAGPPTPAGKCRLARDQRL